MSGASHPKPRLTVLVTHPIQYYAPLYRRLTERGRIELTVIYLTDAGATAHQDPGFSRTVEWDVPLLDGYRYRILGPGTSVNASRFWHRHHPDLETALHESSPDSLLLYGYASRMNWFAARWARRHRVQLAYTSDSNINNPERLVLVKQVLVRFFFRQMTTFLATSECNVRYLRKYGAPAERIRRVPFAVDVGRFKPQSGAAEPSKKYDFIWVGKFIPLKRGADFILALEQLARQRYQPIRACMVGDGPLLGELQQLARGLPAHCHVEFTGFLNQGNMPEALQAANTLVFTSERDAYGLACTEAAAAGLALVVADNNGCVGDSVVARPEVNAITYPAGNLSLLVQALATLHECPARLQAMRTASIGIANEHDVDAAAQVIERMMTNDRPDD